MKKLDVDKIQALCRAVREDILKMTVQAGASGGHIGGALSSVEVLAVLYEAVLNNSPDMVQCCDRDRFILSKGHIALAHYAVLAEKGYISREDMFSFEQKDGFFATHERMCLEKGIEISNGSLGYGLSIGVGCALAGKLKHQTYRVYVLLGDGECNEGSVWEAVMAAKQYNLDNLTAIIDINEQSLDGYTKDIMPIEDFERVFHGYGWNVVSIDGNDIHQVYTGLASVGQNKPTVVLAHTKKAKGLASIEGLVGWHHARLDEIQYEQFMNELGKKTC